MTWSEELKAAVKRDPRKWEVRQADGDEFAALNQNGSTVELTFDGGRVVAADGISVDTGDSCQLDWEFPGAPSPQAADEFIRHFSDW